MCVTREVKESGAPLPYIARRVDVNDDYNLARAVTDPRDGRRVALKKLPNVFQSLVSSKRVFRELKMLCFFKHENRVNFGK
uniref:Protein kinase domain-containing protein n=1 Tax=Anopheles dirus TaxID=7168 RepID=A0A182NMG5_9DIPT